MNLKWAISEVFVILLLVGTPAKPESIGKVRKALNKEYKGKTLLLRTYYRGDTLEFNSDGKLIVSAATGTWTLDGHVYLAKLKLKSDRLDIEGNRVFARYDTGKRQWAGLTDGKVLIQIHLRSSDLTLARLRATLAKIFVTQNEENGRLVPSYWECLTNPSNGGKPGLLKGPYGLLGGDRVWGAFANNRVSAPVAIHYPVPPYSERARSAKLQGVVDFVVVIAGDGTVADVAEISKPLGMGLDQNAAETIRTWAFKPALRKGMPVPVITVVETRFRLM